MPRFKLGVKPHDDDLRNLAFAKYAAALPLPPAFCDWTGGQTSWGMMLNGPNDGTIAPQGLGCCTISAVGHADQTLTKAIGVEYTASDQVIENYYSWWDGYVPGDPSTDQGGIPTVVLNHWRQHTFNGHKLQAYVAPEVQNLTEIKQSISLFGGCYIALNVSNYLMDNQTAPGSTWDVVPDDGGIDGGHAIWCCGYNTETITAISWGNIYYLTQAFWAKYVNESFALLSDDFFNWSTKLSGSGFNFGRMWADLAQL